jgi:Zn-dependent protease
MKGSLSLGRILGIPIQLHVSWFLVAILITWSLAVGYFPQANPGWTPSTYWLVGFGASILFFASVLLHELGHSVLALREKVPVKSITLFIFGGVARIGREPETAGAEFRIAIAGPLTSLGLSALFWVLGTVLAGFDVVAAPLVYLARINLLLALFNMIPGFPLDGGRVLRAVIWAWHGSFRKATRWAAMSGQAIAFLFIGFGVLQFIAGGLANGLWLAFIGWYLHGAARSSYQQVLLRDQLSGIKASSLAIERCLPVPGDLRLDRLVDEHILRDGQRCFLVTDSDDPQGLITLQDVRSVSLRQRDELTTRQVMRPMQTMLMADAEEDAWSLLQRMGEEDVEQLPLAENGRLLGLLTRESLMKHLRLRAELAA